ncbi:MAG: hypothetical protein EOP34_11990, partial [Rickettsiales bacterium]
MLDSLKQNVQRYQVELYQFFLDKNYNMYVIVTIIRIVYILFRYNLFYLICFFIPTYRKYIRSNIDYNNIIKAIEQLGPTFIKFAQNLSTRADIIGERAAEALSKLCDNVPEFDSSIAIDIIEDELDDKLENIFLSFDRIPIGAASIAQVHKATTIDGEVVAVKILRPNITELFERDIKLFRFVTNIINKISRKYERLRLNEVIDLFEKIIKIETDLSLEGAKASELKDNLQDNNNI